MRREGMDARSRPAQAGIQGSKPKGYEAAGFCLSAPG